MPWYPSDVNTSVVHRDRGGRGGGWRFMEPPPVTGLDRHVVEPRRGSTGSDHRKIIHSHSEPATTRSSRRESILGPSGTPTSNPERIRDTLYDRGLDPRNLDTFQLPTSLHVSASRANNMRSGRNRSRSVVFEAFQEQAKMAMRDMAARADNNSAGSFSDRPRSAPPVPPRQKEINTRRSQPDMSFGGIRYADALAMLEKNEPDPHDESARVTTPRITKRFSTMSSDRGRRVNNSSISSNVAIAITEGASSERSAELSALGTPRGSESVDKQRVSLSGGKTPAIPRGRAVSIDVVAQYMVDTTERPEFIAWQDGAILPYSLLVTGTLWFLDLVVFYIAAVVPFEFGIFTADDSYGYLVSLDIFMDIMFAVAVCILLRTAVFINGQLITDRKMLVSLYLRSNFLFDLLSMVPLFIDIANSVTGAPVTLTIRVLRLLRFFRIVKTRQHASGDSGILSVVATSIFVSHIVACVYIAFSVVGSPDHDGWKLDPETLSKSLLSKYLFALTWSLDVMTGFRESESPVTDMEYLFTTLVYLAGTFLFAYVIGRTGDWVSRNTARRENLDLRLSIVEKFIKMHSIPAPLSDDLMEFYRYTWESARGFDAESVLHTLPVCIGVDVSTFIYRTHLSKVEFFERMPASVLSELSKRMDMVVRSPGEKIMTDGQPPFGICFINHGVVDVISRKGERRQSLRTGDMFGDELLRSQAIVTHSYVSRTFCQLFVLQASDVTSVLSAFPTEAAVMAKMMKGKGGGRPQVMPDIMFVDMHAGRWWRLPLFSYRSRIGNLIARTQEVIALYNAFAVLLRIGFDLHHTMLISVLSFDAFVDMLSTFCIIALFHQQYSFNGELVSSRRAIARKYLTGGFFFDMLALLPLHFINMFNPMFRVPRLLGLVRYFAAKQAITVQTTVAKLTRSVITFWLFTHVVACGYFGLTKLEGFAPDTSDDFLPQEHVASQNLFQQYSVAVLVALKILTGRGSKPPQEAMTELQQIYVIISTMLGLFGVAYLIGDISVMVSHFDPLHFVHQLDVDNINKFMKYKHFPLALQRRVRSYLRYRWECTQGVGLKQAIADLPRAIRLRVLEHITLTLIRQIPMFADLSDTLIHGVLECFEYIIVPAKEYIYRKSEMGSDMYIVLDGEVAMGHSGNENIFMGPGSFFGEEAILNKIGLRDTTVRTYTGCTLATLTADALEQVLDEFSEDEHLKLIDEVTESEASDTPVDSVTSSLIRMMVAKNFYAMAPESPVSQNLHTGRELFAFIAKNQPCDEQEAVTLANSLLSNGNLRPLGISSPGSVRIARNNKVPDDAVVDAKALYRLVDFNNNAEQKLETAEEAPAGGGGATATKSASASDATSDSESDSPVSAGGGPPKSVRTARQSLNRAQTLLLKRNSSSPRSTGTGGDASPSVPEKNT